MQTQLTLFFPQAPATEQRRYLHLRNIDREKCEKAIKRLFEIETRYKSWSDELSHPLHTWAAHIITADLDEEMKDRDHFVTHVQKSVQELFTTVLHDSFLPTSELVSPLFIKKEGSERGKFWICEEFFLDESRFEFPVGYTKKAHDYARKILSWIRSPFENDEAQVLAAYQKMRNRLLQTQDGKSFLRSLATGYPCSIKLALTTESVRVQTQRISEERDELRELVRSLIDERARPLVERVRQQIATETQELEEQLARMHLDHKNDMVKQSIELSRLNSLNAEVRAELARQQQQALQDHSEICSLQEALKEVKEKVRDLKKEGKWYKGCSIQ